MKLHPLADEASGLRELRLLGIAHPGLVSTLDAGRLPADGRLFTVTELVEGVMLAPEALAGRHFDVPSSRRLAGRLLSSLAVLHDLGLVHRDIKDANVLLESGSDRPVLIDFGLCCALDEVERESLAGTPRAMAPELFAGGTASCASDLWAAGLVLAEALLGERLFLGLDPAEMAEEREAFAGLSEGDQRTIGDPVLARLLERLLEPDPLRRPESARAALAALELPADVWRVIAREDLDASRSAALRAHDPRVAALRETLLRGELFVDPFAASQTGPAEAFAELVGWALSVDEPTSALRAALDAARAVTDPAPVHLADLLAALGAVRPVVVWIDVAAAEPETRAARTELLRHLAERPGVSALVAPGPGERALAVVRDWLGPREILEQRLTAAAPESFADLEAATAELVRRGAVALDDRGLSWDESRLPASWPLPDGDDPRRDLSAHARVLLDLLALSTRPLSIASLRGLLGDEVVSVLPELEGAGYVARRRGEPDDLLEVGDGRLRRLLAAGPSVEPSVRVALALELARGLAASAGESSADARRREEALAEAVSLALLGPDGGAATVGASDPPELTALLRGCADTLRRLNRLERAEELLARGLRGAPAEVPLLRLHADRIDVLVRRLDFDAARAALAEARSALGELPALSLREGRILQLGGKSAEALEVLEALPIDAMETEDAVLALQFRGESLLRAKRVERAAGEIREALRRHGEKADRRVMVLHELLGQCAVAEGRLDDGVRYYEQCLALAESLGQQAVVGTVLGNLGRALRQRGETRRGLQIQEQGLRRHELAGSTKNLISLLNSVGVGWLSIGRKDVARRHLSRAERLAREAGHDVLLAQVLNNLAVVLAAEGRHDEAEQAWTESLALRKARGDRVGQAAALAYRAHWWLGRGRLHSARADLEDARERLESVQSPHWEHELLLLESDLCLAEGDADQAARAARRVLAGEGAEKEARLRTMALDRLARARGEGLEDVDAEGLERSPVSADLLVTRASLRDAAGRVAEAEADLERAAAILGECPEGMTEGRLLGERVGQDTERLAAALVAVPPDLSLTGMLASRIERDLAQARPLLETLDAQPLLRRLTAHEQRFAELQRKGDVGGLAALAERLRNFERLVEINKKLNTERDAQKLLDVIIDSAIELTGAARGFLILMDGRAEEFRAARNIDERTINDPQFVVSHSVARNVVREGRPMLTANAIDDERLESAASISELKLLSILCVPLIHRGRSLGAVYLDHPQVVGRFHEAHLQTVSSLAELAAIALENARLSDGLQKTNVELRSSQAEISRLNEALVRKLDEREEELEETRESLDASRRALALRYDYSAIVTRSQQMHEVLDLMDRITETHFPVLIHGESGTGKELIARAIHFNGPRKDKNFLSINCAAIAEPLIESELFGSVRGAFTGADRDRKGLFAQAHQGTLFLDEIGDMSLTVQKRLLRVLQEGEFLPVGGREVQTVDVRILCATHRDLKEMVEAGVFREDLFYRLVVARIDLPPLRDRPEDVALLLPHFLARHGAKGTPRLDPEAIALLEAQPWPGNVRELENFAMNLLLFDPGGERIEADLVRRVLGRRLAEPSPSSARASGEATEFVADGAHSLKERLEAFEREQVRSALSRSEGNKAQAARELGVSVRTLYKMLERLGLGDGG